MLAIGTVYRAEILAEAARFGVHDRLEFFEFAAFMANAKRYGDAAEALSIAKGH